MNSSVPIELPLEMWTRLKEFYQKPLRYYHSFTHIEEVLLSFDEIKELCSHPKEVYLAILYHDAVYNYGSKENEKESAIIAVAEIARFLPHEQLDVEYIRRLIELTASHGTLKRGDLTQEERLFLDSDMAILGSSKQRFQLYEQQIKQEYTQAYSVFLYQMGRRRFLKKLLRTDRIYFSEYFYSKLEEAARRNIQASLL